MKRFILGLLMIVGITLAAAPAFAQVALTTEILNWKYINGATYSVSAAPDAYQLPKKYLVGSAADTTTWVSTEGWAMPSMANASGDSTSVVVGRFIIQVDTLSSYSLPGAAGTILTTTTQGSGIGGVDSGPFAYATTIVYSTKFQKFIVIPIYASAHKPLPQYIRLITNGTESVGAARIFVQRFRLAK